jgi:cellulose synthase/poly-beta-1,6-N-acetylglucosamine synthase-like glycosyltransferase
MALIARQGTRAAASTMLPTKTVTVVIATRDSPDVVRWRVGNICQTEYPQERLQVVVAVDRTSSDALEHYRGALGEWADIVEGDSPGGKALTLNAGIRAANGEFIVFADSQQEFAPDVIPHLVGYLDDERFGAVSGAYALESDQGAKTVLGLFWQLELFLRRSEAAIHSLVAVTGAVYGLRRSLWTPLPAGLICDDLFVPLEVVLQGHRVGFCPEARAVDSRRFTKREDFRRKVRTLTGMLQLCAWRPRVLLPWKNPIWVQFMCHKLLRIATPYLLILALIGLLPLVSSVPIRAMLILGAVALLGVFALGALRPGSVKRLASQAVWAVMLQAAPLQASLNAVRGRWNVW